MYNGSPLCAAPDAVYVHVKSSVRLGAPECRTYNVIVNVMTIFMPFHINNVFASITTLGFVILRWT